MVTGILYVYIKFIHTIIDLSVTVTYVCRWQKEGGQGSLGSRGQAPLSFAIENNLSLAT